jgi:hypothetical protein
MAVPSANTVKGSQTESEQTVGKKEATQASVAPRMRWSLVDASVIAFFVAMAYLATCRLWASPTSLTPHANGTDQTFFDFMLLHAVRIFTHGENPFLTPSLNAPIGVNVLANTGLLGLTIPLAPLTAWIGPDPVFVLIITLGLAGTATSWYYVLSRHFIGQRFAALIGGMICGFGPGIVTHANGHPNIVSQFMIPLILWRALAMRNSNRPVRDGLIVGVMITYQVFLNEELLFLAALGGGVFALIYAAFRPREARAAIKPMAKGLGVGAVLAGLLLAVPLWYQFNGPGHFDGLPVWMQTNYRLPVSSFLHTPRLSLWGSEETNSFLATGTEENSFLGVPVLLAALLSAIWLWRRSVAARALVVVALVFAWASFGERVIWGGDLLNPNAPQVLPSIWKFLNHLPIFSSVLPSRLALVAMPAVGLLIAMGVASMARVASDGWRREKPFRVSAAAVAMVAAVFAVLTIVPTPIPADQRGQVPYFFTSGDWKRYVPAGYTVLPADASDTFGSMRWAVTAKLDFGVPGGYFLGPDPTGKGQFGPVFRQTMVLLWDVANGTWHLDSDQEYWRSVAAEDLAYWKTALIVMPVGARNAPELNDTVTKIVGSPGQQVDDVWIWNTKAIADAGGG